MTDLTRPLTSSDVLASDETTSINSETVSVYLQNIYKEFLSKIAAESPVVQEKSKYFLYDGRDEEIKQTVEILNVILFSVAEVEIGISNGSLLKMMTPDGLSSDIPYVKYNQKQTLKTASRANISKKFNSEINEKFKSIYRCSFDLKKEKISSISLDTDAGANFIFAGKISREIEKISDLLKESTKSIDVRLEQLENKNILDEDIRSARKTLDGEIEKRKEIISDLIDELLNERKSVVFDEVSQSERLVAEKLESQATAMLENKKNELVETIINEDAMQLWEKKSKQHTVFFRVGAIVFMTSVLVPVTYLLTHWSAITTAIKDLTPHGQPIALGNLIVVTIPVLGYAWVLRLISRFTLQNMTLADDASQRSVMARTFIRLVGQGQVDESKDRTIMLNALFRPLPGHKEPDIQPPNLADLVGGKK